MKAKRAPLEERWDLICWDSVQKVIPHLQYTNKDKSLISETIREIGLYLSGDRSYDHLLMGWANLLVYTELAHNPDWLIAVENLETLPYHALRILASTCHEGALRYGDYNWLQGFPVTRLLNHALRHLISYGNGNRDEDHLGHSSWGFMTSIFFRDHRPEYCKYLLGPNYSLTEEILEYIRTHQNARSSPSVEGP